MLQESTLCRQFLAKHITGEEVESIQNFFKIGVPFESKEDRRGYFDLKILFYPFYSRIFLQESQPEPEEASLSACSAEGEPLNTMTRWMGKRVSFALCKKIVGFLGHPYSLPESEISDLFDVDIICDGVIVVGSVQPIQENGLIFIPGREENLSHSLISTDPRIDFLEIYTAFCHAYGNAAEIVTQQISIGSSDCVELAVSQEGQVTIERLRQTSATKAFLDPELVDIYDHHLDIQMLNASQLSRMTPS